ncbi:alpha/beta fold hydrolase [Puniceibacterium sp. IMCC21224]|uniref:alpha/beta fold hydrolase n=1 Tax=Puniceibacterium sp. IMCC21224 TaxID=1618204 RepID=UPI00064DA295|nr:alpha/beta hydrolase [Puniceibacterium sp. IMCC21224]KMK67875.1 putative hydrolase or acyltransferase of alpha/beta superfamily [Puniceibacterium sp. IMCC21224]
MQSLYLDTIDATLCWHDLPGAGAPLVCLPALSFAAAANFLDVISDPVLQRHRRLLIDLPGSGFSEPAHNFDYTPRAHAEVVARILDHINLGPSVVFGHSMGGSVAVALADARPDLVRHLVVAEGNLVPGGGAGSRRIGGYDRAEFLKSGYDEALAGIRAEAVAGDEFLSFLHANWTLADPAALHGNACGLIDLDPGLEAAFLGLDLPRTFVYGDKSLAHNPGAADVPEPDHLAEGGVAISVIPQAGHFMTRDNPGAVAQMLAGVLAATEGASA